MEEQNYLEVNKKALRNGCFLDNLDTEAKEDKRISVGLFFSDYDEILYTATSILKGITNYEEEAGKRNFCDIKNTIDLSLKLLNNIPTEFLDNLLIKTKYSKNDFVSVKDL
ncbi:MAG: hypothetical protein K2Q03_00760 [Sphingobacteriaceae bacterium]|nr:hypothetical protein [Sphingobacteriaceae bacterium]